MDVRMPDGTLVQNVPDNITQTELLSRYQKYQSTPEAPKERTWGEAAKDIGAGVTSGVGSLVQLPGQLYGLATGNFEDTGLLGLGKSIAKTGEEMKSEALKQKEAQRSQRIQEAEKQGQWEAFKTAAGETIKDPALLTSFLAEQAPQMVVPFGAAKVGKALTLGKGLGAGLAAEEAAQAAGTAGTRAAIGAGAVQQGADIGTGTYENVYKTLVDKGTPQEEAKSKALNLARASGASGAIISLLAQKLPGAKTLEESFAGVPGTTGRLLGAAKGALGEATSEVAEETGGKFSQNVAMRQVNPEQELTQGLGATAGMAAIGGVGFGGVAGGLRTPQEAPQPTPATQPSPAAPEAPQIDPDKYRSAIEQLRANIPEAGISDAQKIADIFKTAGIQDEAEIGSYVKQAADSGDIKSHVSPFFDVKDAKGTTLFRTTEQAIADKAAQRLNAEEPNKASVVPIEITTLRNNDRYPIGYDVKQGLFKQQEFDIVSGDTVLSPKPMSMDEVDQKAQRLAEIRKDGIKGIDKEVKGLQEKVDQNNLSVESMEAEGQANTPEYAALFKQVAKDNLAIQKNIEELTAKKKSFTEPLLVRPAKASDEGFTVFQNGKPLGHYQTLEEAQGRIVEEPTSVPTQEAIAAKEALRQTLLPFMKQVGLEGTGLRIMDSIESAQGSGDGYYAKNLIAIALSAPNPMATLRHETIHALKELGAFTDQEWKLLESTAKKDWINRFIKNRNTQDGKSLYEAYKAIYLQDKGNLEGFDSYITEEAIADAFKYFNANGTPPGMLGQIFAKIKAFLESLGNQFSGLGFQTADQVFKRVEMGQMRPTRAAPEGNAPRYQEEEPKYSVSPAPEGVPKKAQTTSTAPTAVAKAPTAVAVTPTAVAVTNRAKPTKVMSMEDLGKVIPASERVVSKNPSRLLNGKKFSKANLNKVGEGFFIYKEYGESDAEGLVKKIWEDSIADVEDFVSGSRVGTFIQDLVKSLGAKPPTAKFLNDSFSLSDSARYWYETSAEALDQTTLNIKNKDLLINLISATSQNVPPLPNMRRGISVMSEYTQGKPIETDLISKKPVADAISNRDIQTLKFGNFADTMKFINGYTPNPPVSTNDRQVAAIFNMQPDEFAKNPVLYAVVSKFYAKIRDSQNEMQGEGKQPYESWQIQALNWVEERGNNTSYGTKTADSYDQAIEVITEQLKNAGIPLEKGKIGISTLKDPRVPNLLSGTMDVFQDAVKATVESNTLLNRSGSEANQEYEKIKTINEPWARNLRKEFLMIQTRVLKKLSSSGAIEEVAKLATGQNVKAFEMSRMDAGARGTFEGNLSPNIRIPMFYRKGATKTLITDSEINFILSVLGSGLDQAAMAGSLFKLDANGETYRVFLPDRKITDDEATTFEKNVGFPLNLYDVPNGAVVEINIGGYDTRPTAASVQAALNATFGNNVNAKIAKAAYKSTYLTKEKVEYAPSYREVIYDYRDSKFGRGNKNGFRRTFDDRLTKIAKQLIDIARERDRQFGEFTKDSREKRTAYEQKIGSKTDWAVMGGPSGGKYQLTAARINVDGVMRPTRNSRGALIAATPDGIKNFWRWFGNSIMADSKGFPRVMMHGTARDFERFMPKQAEAIFVTDEPFFAQNFSQLSEDWIAKNYDDPSVGLTDEDINDAKRETLRKMDDLTRREYGLNMKTDPQKFIEYGIDEWRTAVLNRAETRANTVPLYVKLENPFNYQNKDHVKMVVDEMTKNWNGNTHKFETDTLNLIETTISKKQLDGYLSMGDWGYIEHPETIAAIKNLDFDGITMREDMADKNYAVFNRNNVKSAVGNLGAFGQRKLTQEERKAESKREGRTVTAKEAKTRQEEGYIRYSISSPDTPTFKRWFRDSRVVDKDGNPLVMYHATKTPEEGADLFSVFNKSDDGKLGQGIYTTAVEKYAESFAPNGVVMPLWVSIQNPLYLDLTASIQKGRSARDILRSRIAGEEPSREVDYLRLDGNGSREISNGLNAEIQAITGKRMMDMSGASIKRALQKAGYDGIIVRDVDGNFVEVNAFDQTQIKSAIGNRGTYSESNKDIRYSIKSPDTPEFKRWFGNSKVVDKDGKPLVVYHGSVSKGVTVFDTKLVTTRSPKGDIAGTFFTSDLMAATGYTRPSRATIKTPRGEVIQAYLSIKNPLNITAAIKKYKKEGLSFGDAKRKAINALTKENDGIIFDGDGVNPSEYVVFSPNQIKSAIGNRGTFNENNPDIRYSISSLSKDIPQKIWKLHQAARLAEDIASGRKYHPSQIGDGRPINPDQLKRNQTMSFRRFFNAVKEYLPNDEDAQYKLMRDLNVESGRLEEENNPDIRYSLRDAFDADFNATFGTAGNDALNRATYVRQDKGFAQRIAEAISPDSVTAIRQKLFNKYEAVERLSKRVAADTRPGFLGAKELLADVSANAAALQADRAAGVAAEALMNGIPVYEKGYTKVTDMGGKVKGLIPILEPLLKKYQNPKILQMFQFYSATRRGIRLYDEGREHVLTPADFALGDAFEVKYPEFKTAYDEYQKFNEGLVKFLIDTGVLSKAMGAEWTKYGDYIPFYRQIDGKTTVGPKMFQNLSNIKITPELTGSDKQIGDYLETVVRNTRSAIEQGMKNVAAQRIVRDIMRLNTQGMNDMGRKLQPHEKGGSDVVTVRENGDDVRYQVIDPLLVESMKSLHNMGINSFWTLMSYPTQLLRNLVTKEPSFILANLARDSMQAWVTSGVSMTPLVDTFKQFGKVLANQSPEAKALKAAGIGTGYEFSGDVKASAKAVADALNDRAGIKTGWQKAMWPVSKVWDALDKGSNASDLATRAEIYKKVLAETGNEAEAIYQSLEVMNFGRMGSSPMIQVISALVPFFNARVQGMDVLYRAGFGRMASQNSKAQHKAFMYRALFIAAMSSLYWLMARDTDEWKRASKETRDNYWLIGNVKIPIPFEIGVLFKVAPERILETAFGNDTGEDLAESALRNIVSTLKINPVPQAFLPILEESVNYSLFTGMPIVGRGMENVAAPYQRNSSTTELSIMLGEQLNLSPIRIDHVLSAYTGSMGMYMAQMIGAVINTVSDNEVTRPAMSIEQTPVLKRFFASDKSGGTVDAFYSLKKEVDVVVRTQHELQSRGNPEQYAEYMEKNGQLLGLKGLVSSIDRQLTQFRELRNKIQFASLDPKEKREALDNIRYAEIAITENIKEIKKNALQ